MSKTVQTVKNSLKFKAQEKEGLLTVRFGVKKFVLPVAARMLCDGKYMFLSFGASSELYEVNGKGLTAMDKDADADAAFEALNVTKRRGRPRKNSETAISPELQKLLSEIPAGHKLIVVDGKARLVKTRTRRKKNG